MNQMGEPLSKQLSVKEEQFRSRFPAEDEVLRQSIAYLQQAGLTAGLQAGDKAPDFTLTDVHGNAFTLSEETARGAVILTFYRGGWCPFCNLQLRAYQEILPQLRRFGASLVAISPQSSERALTQQEKEEFIYIIASDPDGRVASRYRILYEASDSLNHVYGKLGIDLAAINANGSLVLPVPATFVIDTSSTIRFAYVEPDFRQRLEPKIILEVLGSICGKEG
jgi:peroxiredoxin